MRSRRFRRVVLLFLAVLAGAAAVRAQEEWSWPEKPKNLQVLPKDFTGKKLGPIMTGFTRALGVRCPYCHVGEEGKPLGTFDFASDQNPNKERAREMYRMLGSINGHLKKITPSGDTRVNMWCNTCHQGRPRPTTLEKRSARRTGDPESRLRSRGIASFENAITAGAPTISASDRSTRSAASFSEREIGTERSRYCD
jgi:Photosynthetic reaction centre cytochrome C subunit